jgi:hypothetical protein
MMNYKQYLGDSVYANYDGHHIVLTTENNLEDDPSNRICLEPEVLNSLNTYVLELSKFLYREREE